MLKVVHIISDTNIGGAGRYLLNILRTYDRSSFTVKVICPLHGLLAQEVKAQGVEVLPLTEGEKSFSRKSIGDLLAVLRQERPHVVHTHASLSGRVAARLAGVPVIVLTRHGIGEQVSGLKRLANQAVSRLFTDGVIAISHAVEETLLRQGISGRMVRTIYNGIDLADCTGSVDPEPVRREFSLEGGPVIGVIARLTGEKGHSFFLAGIPSILKSFPAAKFLLVGEGGLRTQLQEQVARLGIEKSVVFTGYRKDVLAIIEALDISVLPSVSEGLGLALLESMARRKPIVATNAGGIPEVVEDGVSGILVPPADPEALAEAVLRLLRSPELGRKMGEQGRAILENKFSAVKMTAGIEGFYRELLQKKGIRG